MSYNNTVAIISNAEFTIQEIKSMLVLLREIDKVDCYDYYNAEENIKKNLPNVVILHSSENDKNCLKLLKKIRHNEKTKDIPVILYAEYPNTDYIIEAFDAGMTDILTSPLQDFELVIRVIWAIQRSETNLIRQSKDDFLARLGIIDEKTGFYKEEFSLKYLESVITKAKINKQKSCLMMVKTRQTIGSEVDRELLINSLKSSVRLNDTIAIKDEHTYYIFLSKAKLNGVYSVYERLTSKVGVAISISASVVEIQDELFDNIINVLDYSINKAPKNGEIAVVTKQDFVEMYKEEDLGISRLINDNKEEVKRETSIKRVEIIEEPKETREEQEETKEEKIDLGLKIMEEKVKEVKRTGNKLLRPKAKIGKIQHEDKDVDERNAVLYKQSYAKKNTMVIEPLLKRYAGKFQNEYPLLDARVEVSSRFAYLKFDKGDVELSFELIYDGIKSVKFDSKIKALGTEIESDSFLMEVTEFDYQKLDIILKTITDEYKSYISD